MDFLKLSALSILLLLLFANITFSVETKKKGVVMTDTGLSYKIIKEGTGETPQKGDNVTVHYIGKLTDGSVFDSSKQRGPFTFVLGIGQVIKGWDQGVSEMKKGEIRELTIPHDLAYGERGYPPVIPPKATLIFEVELLDFN
ncbi:MAG: hypothetical protein GTO02_15660 [Candidatus Dadabacteria bacterium]|nr:hypothetical protein [Candidatus Dadabacteria bacterium]NIQ15771.1 hypothetical protein [Candidatus Dadabacteria bacterium]